ncbi:uncharacterized protein zgc:193811 isoform X2 [Trichomycterus rosablanca]
MDGLLGNRVYSKAPPHWHTHYLNDLAWRMKQCKSVVCTPLTEMREQYRGQPASHELLVDHYRTLKALHKQLAPFSALLPREAATEVSTAHTDYRSFSRSELAPFPDTPPTTTLTTSAALSRLPPHKAPPSLSSRLQPPLPSLPLTRDKISVYRNSFTSPAPRTMSCTPAALHHRTERSEQGFSLRHVLDVPKMYSTENQSYGRGRMVLV